MARGLFFIVLCGFMLIFSAPLGHADGGAPNDPDTPANDSGSGTTTTSNSAQSVSNPILFIDVPSDHWVVEDLKYLVENGIITGLPNGTFDGEEPLSRYSAAALVSRAIRFVSRNPSLVNEEDVNALQELMFELSDQVEQNAGELDGLKAQVADLPRDDGVSPQISNRLTQAEETISALQSEVNRLSRQLGGDGASAAAPEQLKKVQQQANANFIIAISGLFIGIIGVALATMT